MRREIAKKKQNTKEIRKNLKSTNSRLTVQTQRKTKETSYEDEDYYCLVCLELLESVVQKKSGYSVVSVNVALTLLALKARKFACDKTVNPSRV